jgi:hypothetical protein
MTPRAPFYLYRLQPVGECCHPYRYMVLNAVFRWSDIVFRERIAICMN